MYLVCLFSTGVPLANIPTKIANIKFCNNEIILGEAKWRYENFEFTWVENGGFYNLQIVEYSVGQAYHVVRCFAVVEYFIVQLLQWGHFHQIEVYNQWNKFLNLYIVNSIIEVAIKETMNVVLRLVLSPTG